MSDNNHTGAFMAGFIIGGLVGAAAALLMTPQPGEKTRLQIQERGLELKSQLEERTVDTRAQAKKLAAELQERGKGVIEERLKGGGLKTEMPLDTEETAETASGQADEAAS
jgi:gas vesicle protein